LLVQSFGPLSADSIFVAFTVLSHQSYISYIPLGMADGLTLQPKSTGQHWLPLNENGNTLYTNCFQLLFLAFPVAQPTATEHCVMQTEIQEKLVLITTTTWLFVLMTVEMLRSWTAYNHQTENHFHLPPSWLKPQNNRFSKVTSCTSILSFSVMFNHTTLALHDAQDKRLNVIALLNKSSQSYWVSLAFSDHAVLHATWYKWTHPAITPARQAGTRFTYPEGWKATLTYVTG